ncbi:MAG TPA: PhoPQ-activated protein PqaA family protein, partial [Fimbriimonadaceae bacterium]|nr:PhoPQ-activated protein PqaA family protein [Fimbriimonadaceae bacterium]
MLAAIFLSFVDATPKELGAYVVKPESVYGFTELDSRGTHRELRLTSQQWRGTTWRHDLVLTGGENSDTAILIVTGDRVEADDRFAEDLSRRARLPVATLYNVPNQPLWDMREDDLIAHTFAQFLESGDAEWPLLFPMTKSVVKAMDAI